MTAPEPAPPRHPCVDCGAATKGRSKTGLCGRCARGRVARDPQAIAKRVVSWKRRLAAEPALREKLREVGRQSACVEGARAHRSALAKARGLAEIGRRARTPESFAKMARSISDRRLADIPRELRGEYLRRLRSSKIPAAELRRMFIEQHERDMARFRAKLGAAA